MERAEPMWHHSGVIWQLVTLGFWQITSSWRHIPSVRSIERENECGFYITQIIQKQPPSSCFVIFSKSFRSSETEQHNNRAQVRENRIALSLLVLEIPRKTMEFETPCTFKDSFFAVIVTVFHILICFFINLDNRTLVRYQPHSWRLW